MPRKVNSFFLNLPETYRTSVKAFRTRLLRGDGQWLHWQGARDQLPSWHLPAGTVVPARVIAPVDGVRGGWNEAFSWCRVRRDREAVGEPAGVRRSHLNSLTRAGC